MQGMLARQWHVVPMAECQKILSQVGEVRMRFINWLLTSWRLRPETVFLTVSLIDQYIAKSAAVQGRRFGLVSISALSLAARCEELVTPSVQELLAAMDHAYSWQELSRMEAQMQATLGCESARPTAAHMLPRLLEAMRAWMTTSAVCQLSASVATLAKEQAAWEAGAAGTVPQDDAREALAWWFAKLALFNLRLAGFAPSAVAAAAVLLSNRICGCRPWWPAALARLSGQSQSDLDAVVLLMERHWKTRRS